AQRHVLSCRDTWRDLHGDLVIATESPLATTLLARRLDDTPFTMAGGTRGDRHELPEERALCTAHFAGAATGRARLCLRSGLRTTAGAVIAWIEKLHCNLLIDAARHLGKRQRHSHLDVGAGRRTAAARAAAAEQLFETAKPAEVPHEDAERFGEVDVMESAGAPAAKARFAIPVVRRPLLRITKDVICLRDLLEPLLGFLRAVVAVRMIRH